MTDLFGQEAIKALTWKQPFATLMLYGKLETRSWATTYRGLVLICVGKEKPDHTETLRLAGEGGFKLINEFYQKHKINPELVLGKAIAVGRLTRCRAMQPGDAKAAFVDYVPGLFIHEYTDVRRIEPVAFTRSQRWQNLDPDFLESLKFID